MGSGWQAPQKSKREKKKKTTETICKIDPKYLYQVGLFQGRRHHRNSSQQGSGENTCIITTLTNARIAAPQLHTFSQTIRTYFCPLFLCSICCGFTHPCSVIVRIHSMEALRLKCCVNFRLHAISVA